MDCSARGGHLGYCVVARSYRRGNSARLPARSAATRVKVGDESVAVATLIIITFVIIIFVILLVLTLPVIVREFAYFIESFPLYVRRLHALTTDAKPALGVKSSARAWEAKRSVGDFTTLASDWFGTFLRSVWSGGRLSTATEVSHTRDRTSSAGYHSRSRVKPEATRSS